MTAAIPKRARCSRSTRGSVVASSIVTGRRVQSPSTLCGSSSFGITVPTDVRVEPVGVRDLESALLVQVDGTGVGFERSRASCSTRFTTSLGSSGERMSVSMARHAVARRPISLSWPSLRFRVVATVPRPFTPLSERRIRTPEGAAKCATPSGSHSPTTPHTIPSPSPSEPGRGGNHSGTTRRVSVRPYSGLRALTWMLAKSRAVSRASSVETAPVSPISSTNISSMESSSPAYARSSTTRISAKPAAARSAR